MAATERQAIEEGPRTPTVHTEPSMRFVTSTGEEPAYFMLTTRRGQELRLDPQNPVMVGLIDTVLDNVTNTEQGMGPIDLAERVFVAIESRGIKIEEGADHAKALEYLNRALTVWLNTESLVKRGKQLKVEESVLDQIATAVGLSGRDFRRLNPGIQEATLDSIQGVTLAALGEVIDQNVPVTADRLLKAHKLLMQRKTDLVQGWILSIGQGIGGFGGRLIGEGIGGGIGHGVGAFNKAKKGQPRLGDFESSS